MMCENKTLEDYGELEKAFSPLGFTQVSPGIFKHELVGREFNFSALSLKGAIKQIWSDGYRSGEIAVQQKIKITLGIKS